MPRPSFFEFVPKDVIVYLGNFFRSPNDIAAYAGASENVAQFITLISFLSYVAHGQQKEAQQMLKTNSSLLLEYSDVTDIGGSYFPRITAFQLAIYLGDVRYMCGMMLDCVAEFSESNSIATQLLNQYNELMEKKVTYRLDGKDYQEQQYSLTPLIEALKESYRIKRSGDGSKRSKEILGKQWREVVGKLQRSLPAHVRHHYCDNAISSVTGRKEFSLTTLDRGLSVLNIEGRHEDWGPSLDGLGSTFAIQGMFNGRPICVDLPDQGGRAGTLLNDIACLETLSVTRKEDLKNLHKRVLSLTERSQQCVIS